MEQEFKVHLGAMLSGAARIHSSFFRDELVRSIPAGEDPIVGGEGKGKKIRQALSLAHDIDEANDLFYNGINKVYSGVIPPGVGGFDAKVRQTGSSRVEC